MKNIHITLTKEEARIALRALEFNIAKQFRQRNHWLGVDTAHAREWRAEDFAKLRTTIALARKLDLKDDTIFRNRLGDPVCKTFADLRARRLQDKKDLQSKLSAAPGGASQSGESSERTVAPGPFLKAA